MKNLIRFSLFRPSDYPILEKSIGSEAIRLKWYADLDKKTFYKIVNLDPTSVRKKDFSKPGKYTKWLIMMYKKNLAHILAKEKVRLSARTGRIAIQGHGFYENLEEVKEVVLNQFDDKLNLYLFVFSSGWYKSKSKKEPSKYPRDIFKFNNLREFKNKMYELNQLFLRETDKAKWDVVYSDDKIDIMIPINFTASWESAQNTEWCTALFSEFSQWNKIAILFRIIPKDKSYQKLKITWQKNSWSLAEQQYPEISSYNLEETRKKKPFDKIGNIEAWQFIIDEKRKKAKADVDLLDSKIFSVTDKIEKTMSLVSDEAKKCIVEYWEKNIKSKK